MVVKNELVKIMKKDHKKWRKLHKKADNKEEKFKKRLSKMKAV